MDVLWRRHHRSSGLRLDHRPGRGAVREARGAAGKQAARGIDLETMERLGGDIDGVQVKLAARHVAHPAFSAEFVIDFERRHDYSMTRWKIAPIGPFCSSVSRSITRFTSSRRNFA